MEDFKKLCFKSFKEDGYLTKLEMVDNDDSIDAEVKKQLEEYFSKERTIFNLPIKLKGTDFQVSVWKKISEIPYGKTTTYGEIAESLGNGKLARAVGTACGKNPIAIIIPCHRVLGSNGKLGGYSYGIEIKKKLLDLEGVEYGR